MSSSDYITYQHLTDADLPLMRGLLGMFGEAFGDVPTYQHAVPSDAYLRQLLSNPSFIAVVASCGEKIVGGLAAYVLDKFEQERREIYIYDLAVAQAYRRKGIATAAIGELQKIAQARGAYVIFVQADLDDQPAIALYESLGTKETAHHFDIEVRPKGRNRG